MPDPLRQMIAKLAREEAEEEEGDTTAVGAGKPEDEQKAQETEEKGQEGTSEVDEEKPEPEGKPEGEEEAEQEEEEELPEGFTTVELPEGVLDGVSQLVVPEDEAEAFGKLAQGLRAAREAEGRKAELDRRQREIENYERQVAEQGADLIRRVATDPLAAVRELFGDEAARSELRYLVLKHADLLREEDVQSALEDERARSLAVRELEMERRQREDHAQKISQTVIEHYRWLADVKATLDELILQEVPTEDRDEARLDMARDLEAEYERRKAAGKPPFAPKEVRELVARRLARYRATKAPTDDAAKAAAQKQQALQKQAKAVASGGTKVKPVAGLPPGRPKAGMTLTEVLKQLRKQV